MRLYSNEIYELSYILNDYLKDTCAIYFQITGKSIPLKPRSAARCKYFTNFQRFLRTCITSFYQWIKICSSRRVSKIFFSSVYKTTVNRYLLRFFYVITLSRQRVPNKLKTHQTVFASHFGNWIINCDITPSITTVGDIIYSLCNLSFILWNNFIVSEWLLMWIGSTLYFFRYF